MSAAQRALPELLANRRWIYCVDPFPHVLARNVFVESFYHELAAGFDELLARGLTEAHAPGRLSKTIPGYDAYGMNFAPEEAGPFGVFLSRPWHDMLARLFDVDATGHVNGGFHYHAAGSSAGWVHHDLNEGWFAGPAQTDTVTLAHHELCSYQSGEAYCAGITPLRTVRAIAMMFYLGNASWTTGDGGATGLYRTRDDPVDRPAVVVPPFNNSMLVFECSPFSFHSYMGHNRRARSSVIMWLHRPWTDVIARWGEGCIGTWPGRPTSKSASAS